MGYIRSNEEWQAKMDEGVRHGLHDYNGNPIKPSPVPPQTLITDTRR